MVNKSKWQDGVTAYKCINGGLFFGDELICTTNELYEEYCLNQVNCKELAEKFQIAESGLRKLIKIAKIPRRTKSEIVTKQWERKRSGADPEGIYYKGKMLCTRLELCNLYWKDELSNEEIGKKLNLSRHAISQIMKRNKIPTRTLREVGILWHRKERESLDPNYMYRIDKTIICSKEEFKKLYYEEFLSITELAKKFNTTPNTLRRKATNAGFVLRSNKEQYRLAFRLRDYSGKNSPGWNGGRNKNDAGYICVWCPDHPLADRKGYVREHQLVMEEIIGRNIAKGEVIHHINFIKSDNSPENLYLFPDISSHIKAHMGLGKIVNELYNQGILIFENGKYLVNKHMTNKLRDNTL